MAGVVFDLDGTLIDSVPDIQAVANTVLAGEGVAALSLADTRSFVGLGADVFVQRMRAARGLADSDHGRLLAAFLHGYETAVDRTTLYPGVPTALAALRAQGHQLGLCTNKPTGPTRAVLAHLRLAGYFDTVICGDTLPLRKPDPAPIHAAFQRIGPGVYVGDSDVDAEAAERAGVPFVLFTQGYCRVPLSTLTCAARLDDFAALPGVVQSLVNVR